MQLGDIIEYLNALDNCILTTVDKWTGKEIDSWEGTVINIPWYYIDYYLYNSGDYEAIGVNCVDGKTFLDISLYDANSNN